MREAGAIDDGVLDALSDDLNTPLTAHSAVTKGRGGTLEWRQLALQGQSWLEL